MPDGTGVAAFGKRFPDRFFDVGIAEAHAVTSAAGMAAAGLRPVVAVYSSFLQRGYDRFYMMSVSRTCRLSLQWTGRDW